MASQEQLAFLGKFEIFSPHGSSLSLPNTPSDGLKSMHKKIQTHKDSTQHDEEAFHDPPHERRLLVLHGGGEGHSFSSEWQFDRGQSGDHRGSEGGIRERFERRLCCRLRRYLWSHSGFERSRVLKKMSNEMWYNEMK